MGNENLLDMIWKVGWVVVVIGAIVWVAWRRVREKRKLSDLAILAIIEAQKLKMKDGQTEKKID